MKKIFRSENNRCQNETSKYTMDPTQLMGEGFILLTRGYGFMGGVPSPFDTLKNVLLLMI